MADRAAHAEKRAMAMGRAGRETVLYVGSDWEGRYPVHGRSERPRWLVSFVGRPDPRWSVWQVSWRAHVGGVPGSVDLDVGRLADLDPG